MLAPMQRISDSLELCDHELDEPLIADSEIMRATVETLGQLAERAAPLVIHGEPGVGMRWLTLWAHRTSSRRAAPCVVASNGSRVPESLHEPILFGRGHERGAIELAQGGVLILDDAHDLSPELIRRLRSASGGCQIVAKWYGDAASLDPELAAQFPTHVEVPALRDRGRSDFLQFVELFLRKFSAGGRPPPELSAETIDRLSAMVWPGNVRALKNRIEIAVLLHQSEGRSLDELLRPIEEP
jgi:two-component system, NtrC family, nitrogen regulation response regulator NtrX